MNKSIYIITPNSYSGKILVSLGIMQTIIRNTPNVAYFKPILERADDNHISTMISQFAVDRKSVV